MRRSVFGMFFWTVCACILSSVLVLWIWGVVAQVQQTGFGR